MTTDTESRAREGGSWRDDQMNGSRVWGMVRWQMRDLVSCCIELSFAMGWVRLRWLLSAPRCVIQWAHK